MPPAPSPEGAGRDGAAQRQVISPTLQPAPCGLHFQGAGTPSTIEQISAGRSVVTELKLLYGKLW
jgi:hypothetical protein